MSAVNPHVDLEAFARREPEVKPPRRRWLRLVLPPVLILGFAAVLVTSMTDLFVRAVEVTIIRPVPSTGGPAAGQVLFQAAGWVEPDPFPVRVTPLAAGVVEEVKVQESDRVEAGEVVALLVAEDAQLALRTAESSLALALAARDRARAERDRAQESFEAALEVTESLAMTAAEVSGKEAESRHREQAVVKAEAQLRLAAEELALQEHLAGEGAAGPRQVEIAEARVAEARGELEVMKALAVLARAEAAKAAARYQRAQRDFELRIEERLRLERTRAELAAAEARVQEAASGRDEARLRLDRMTVRAPVSGLVLARLAVPGQAIAPEGPEAGAICTLYDPKEVRVRVDVPQSEVGKAAPGLGALIRSEIRRDNPYHGRVIRVVQEADINKVTLQVHVRVLEPDEFLRPEMLCTVSVLAPTSEETSVNVSHLKVPARVVEGDAVWVLDPTSGCSRRRAVRVGLRAGEWVEVLEGLNLSDKIIDRSNRPLEEGMRVREGR